MHPELVRIGSFALPTYGVLLACGFLAALWLLRRRARAWGISPEAVSDVAIWTLLAGILGAKLLLVIVEWPQHVRSWAAVGELFRSGGVFYGGLLGAIPATWILLHRKQLSFWTFADVAAPSVALGQAIGRLGCLAAGCCWGRECHLPWAVTFTNPAAERNVGVPLNVPLHPTQLYESIGCFVLVALLLLFEKRRFSGETFARYLFGYALLRGTIEFFRGDPRGSVFSSALSTSQFIALLGIAAAIAIWTLRRGKPPVPAPA